MKRFTVVIALVVGVLVAAAAGYVLRGYTQAPAASPATPASVPQTVAKVNGVTLVTVDPATQQHSGIRTQQLTAALYRSEVVASAMVLDLQPLIDLRVRYAAAQAERAATAAQAEAARHEFERTGALFRDNQNMSLKAYQAAEATYRAERARAEAAMATENNLRGSLRTQFGDTLAQWAMDPRSAAFQRLLNRQDVLLRVSVPPGFVGAPPSKIEVSGVDNRRQPAELVSRAAQSDPAVPGDAFVYRSAITATASVAAGTRVSAFLPAPATRAEIGVVVPADALIWYGGQPWAYVKTAPDRFARTPVSISAPANGGYFVTQPIQQGAQVVVQGAQLLLSEELKPRASGSACKDPECD